MLGYGLLFVCGGVTGVFLPDEVHAEGGQKHEEGGKGHHPAGTCAVDAHLFDLAHECVVAPREDQRLDQVDDPAAEQSHADLRNGDRKVEDPHVGPRVPGVDRPREDGVGHGQNARPGDPDEDHRHHQQVAVLEERQPQVARGAAQQTQCIDGLVAVAVGQARHEEGHQAGRHGVDGVEDSGPCLGRTDVDRPGRLVDEGRGDQRLQVVPHQEEGRPAEELRHAELPHRAGNVAQQRQEPPGGLRFVRALLLRVVASELPGGILPDLEGGDEHRQQQDGPSGVVGVGDMARDAPLDRRVGDAAPGHDEREKSPDDGPEVDQKGLDDEPLGLLRIVEHVGDQRPEGLHRDVEREVHEQQDQRPHHQRGEGQQRRAVGHQQKGDRRDDGASEDVGDPASETRPRPVGKEAYDGLNDQSGKGRRQPEVAQVTQIGSHRLQNARRIGVLQRIADLYAQEAEAEIPDLPEGEFRFFHFRF